MHLRKLSENEMKFILGGKRTYYCSRSKREGNYISTYTFNTESEKVAISWCDFWDYVGWFVEMRYVDDNSDNYNPPFYYT